MASPEQPILPPPSITVPQLDTKQLFAYLTNASADPLHHYYYSNEAHLSFRHVLRDVPQRLEVLSVKEKAYGRDSDSDSKSKPKTPGSSTYVWLGATNLTAQTHYDSVHNFYVQLLGSKRFVLSPPSDSASFHLHPLEHAYDRQSQVDYAAPPQVQAALWPHFGTATGWVADLDKGDVLYVPPFWFHRVTSGAAVRGTAFTTTGSANDSEQNVWSASVNVWSDCVEGERRDRAVKLV